MISDYDNELPIEVNICHLKSAARKNEKKTFKNDCLKIVSNKMSVQWNIRCRQNPTDSVPGSNATCMETYKKEECRDSMHDSVDHMVLCMEAHGSLINWDPILCIHENAKNQLLIGANFAILQIHGRTTRVSRQLLENIFLYCFRSSSYFPK